MKCIVIYAAGHSWTKLFQGYNILKGRVWSLVLIWTAVASYLYLQNQVITRH